MSLLERGGPLMWVLLAMSLFGLVMFVERLLFLHIGQIRTEQFLAGIKTNLRNRRLIEALTVCESTPGPVANVLKSILLHYEEGEERMRMAAQAAALVEIPALERRLGTLAALARVAPLLGLVGTLVGISETFFGVVDSAAPAFPSFGIFLEGLGEAMLTTLVGLMFAIMAHLAHHFLYGRVRALVHDMEYAGHHLIEFLLFELPDKQARDAEQGDERAPPAGSRVLHE
ncbi:MAG: MotA/TolQ/ExbB proton channel family protein [Opitutales bacterium]